MVDACTTYYYVLVQHYTVATRYYMSQPEEIAFLAIEITVILSGSCNYVDVVAFVPGFSASEPLRKTPCRCV